MKRVHEKYFVCPDGHITVGDNVKKKCGAELWQLNYIKGKRKNSWNLQKEKVPSCSLEINEEGSIPEEIDWTTVWDHKIMHAFLMDQKLDAEFMVSLQKLYSKMWNEIQELKRRLDEIPRRD